MDFKSVEEKVKHVVTTAASDKEFHEQFKKEPIKAIEGLLGTDLPDEQVKAVVEGAKAKLHLEEGMETVKDTFENVEDKVKGLFHKDK